MRRRGCQSVTGQGGCVVLQARTIRRGAESERERDDLYGLCNRGSHVHSELLPPVYPVFGDGGGEGVSYRAGRIHTTLGRADYAGEKTLMNIERVLMGFKGYGG